MAEIRRPSFAWALRLVGETVAMAFGQQSGPPASPRQLSELLRLLNAAGHSDFRDARGPMGFNQRQAAGKFTRDEAAGFIEQLENEEAPELVEPVETRTIRRRVDPIAPNHPVDNEAPSPALFSDRELADELERRGWIVIAP